MSVRGSDRQENSITRIDYSSRRLHGNGKGNRAKSAKTIAPDAKNLSARTDSIGWDGSSYIDWV
ncbi:MAG: hypothetical protein D6680_23145 [Cyanobacteria bacterium J007]|nr:MAG: hypothetical protein D6680_23145 [Cyanobacteria bacterium J007]